MSLALESKLIGTVIYTSDGNFKILDYIKYDSQTHEFTLELQNVKTDATIVSQISDKDKFDVEISKRRIPNYKRLKPKKAVKTSYQKS